MTLTARRSTIPGMVQESAPKPSANFLRMWAALLTTGAHDLHIVWKRYHAQGLAVRRIWR